MIGEACAIIDLKEKPPKVATVLRNAAWIEKQRTGPSIVEMREFERDAGAMATSLIGEATSPDIPYCLKVSEVA